MFYRKLYLKIRLFLYNNRAIINSFVVSAMTLTLIYMAVNYFVFENFINSQASNYVLSGKYKEAIKLYDFEYEYYKIFHFSDTNKEIYFEIPYRRALCYLKENQKQKSIESMVNGLAVIEKQYGIFSRETAYFIRKYLIEYYLDNHNHRLASQEFKNLLVIYKTIGYNGIEMADLVRLSGDLFYEQKKYDIAMDFYKKAYNTISKEKDIDYEILIKIVDRITAYEILNKETDKAISVYQSSIEILKNSGKKQKQLTAYLLLQLGDVYNNNEKTKDAIKCYEEALALIRTLPRVNYLRQNKVTYLKELKELYHKDGQFHKVDEVEVEMAKDRRF